MDQGLEVKQPTYDRFLQNIAGAGLNGAVTSLRAKATDVDWDQPIRLLFIDALHDYANVSQDFHHFEDWVVTGGLIAFHDYADYYPGVMTFVDELLDTGAYEKVGHASSLIVIRKLVEAKPIPRPTAAPASPLSTER